MIFRLARHTNRLPALRSFYTEVLGFEITGEFTDHEGYNGIFVSAGNAGWHLEFTESGMAAESVPDADDLLVFYPETEAAFEALKTRISVAGLPLLTAQNPYWNRHGLMIQDPDGFRIVISGQRIRPT